MIRHNDVSLALKRIFWTSRDSLPQIHPENPAVGNLRFLANLATDIDNVNVTRIKPKLVDEIKNLLSEAVLKVRRDHPAEAFRLKEAHNHFLSVIGGNHRRII